jgi:hypothetical protein
VKARYSVPPLEGDFITIEAVDKSVVVLRVQDIEMLHLKPVVAT